MKWGFKSVNAAFAGLKADATKFGELGNPELWILGIKSGL
jgi:hypothetical protein